MYNIDKKEIIRTFKLFYTGGSSMKKIRNILAMLMVVVMLVAVMPMNVFAEGERIPTDPPKYTITITEPTNGSVSAKAGDSELTEGAKLAEGTVVTLTATPNDGYEFDSYNVTGAEVTVTNGTFTMPAAEVTVTAKFKKTETEADKKAKELEDAKAKAKTTVSGLDNLTEKEKTGFTDRIDKASKIEEIQPIVEEAKAKAAENKKAKEDEEKKKEEEKKALAKAKEDAKAAVDKLDKLSDADKKSFKDKIDTADNKADVDRILKEATDKANPQPTPIKTVKVVTIGNGTASVDNAYATKGQSVTVTAKPYSGYAVARVYLNYAGITKNINTYYNGYYYDGRYYGRYNDYYKYLNEYNNSNYHSYREFLRHEYPRHYRYYKDYDYWTDRYDYDWYDRYDNYYYKYLDDYNRYYSDRYATYEDYLKVYHYPHYRDYYDYRYDYRYHNYRYGYNTSDTFDMPASDVTVYVEFTDAYPYYYDDYYYYRSRRDKEAEEAKAKKEAAKKEEEEAKAKAEAEKLPQVYENKAVIAIGSNVLDKVSKNVHTVHQMDTPAYVKNGRVMLPLRYVAEALGLQVSWVPETKTVIIWDLTQRVEIPVKSNRIIVNGITYTSDVKPEIKSSRTMLPIANIARALGLIDGSDIIWDQYNKQVTLTRKVLSK